MTVVALDSDRCPTCGTGLTSAAWEQLPLLRHGGYGAAERTVRRTCPGCGWSLTVERGDVRPPERPVVTLCAYCAGRGRITPAATTVRTANGVNTACQACADDLDEARRAAQDHVDQLREERDG